MMLLPLAVYPRRYGEHKYAESRANLKHGLSPQVRGTLEAEIDDVCNNRFIPAGTGNTGSPLAQALRKTVYPRRYGEHITSGTALFVDNGLSPQVRGTQEPVKDNVENLRFIPAGTGNTWFSLS
mgnify:CR=1 FL=1